MTSPKPGSLEEIIMLALASHKFQHPEDAKTYGDGGIQRNDDIAAAQRIAETVAAEIRKSEKWKEMVRAWRTRT